MDPNTGKIIGYTGENTMNFQQISEENDQIEKLPKE